MKTFFKKKEGTNNFIMSMLLESFVPCPINVNACVDGEERGDNPCCPQQLNPRIISPDSEYVATFKWDTTGGLFALVPNGASWRLEVLMEDLGGRPDANINDFALVNHVSTASNQAYTGSVTLGKGELQAGKVYRPIFKLHLVHNGVLVVCAFSDGDIIHVNDQY